MGRFFLIVLAAVLGLRNASAATGDLLDRSTLGELSFSEEAETPLSFWRVLKPEGRWQSKYWFGDPNGISSRTWDQLVDIVVDQDYCGLNPFILNKGQLELVVDRNPHPDDPKLAKREFVSAILTTAPSFTQQYGYFEIRAKLPDSQGFWPAFWLWSKEGGLGNEIDILEAQTSEQTTTFHSIHLRNVWKAEQGGEKKEQIKTRTIPVNGGSISEFHVYGVLWRPKDLVWYVDGVEVARLDNPGFHDPMFVIVSMGVGGWEKTNQPGKETRFPNRMTVDFIRVYKPRG